MNNNYSKNSNRIIFSIRDATVFLPHNPPYGYLFLFCSQKEAAIEKPAEEPKGFKVGKGKLPDENNERDSATLRPVIIEPPTVRINILKELNKYYFIREPILYTKIKILVRPNKLFLRCRKRVLGRTLQTCVFFLIIYIFLISLIFLSLPHSTPDILLFYTINCIIRVCM